MADDEPSSAARRTTIRPPLRAYDVVVRKEDEAAAARGDANATLGLVWHVAGDDDSELDDDGDGSHDGDDGSSSEEGDDGTEATASSDDAAWETDDDAASGSRASSPSTASPRTRAHPRGDDRPAPLEDGTAEVAWLTPDAARLALGCLVHATGPGATPGADEPFAVGPGNVPLGAWAISPAGGRAVSARSAAAADLERAARPSGADHLHPTLEAMDGLAVVDRALVDGDIVARSSDPLGPTGVVVAVDRSLTVRLLPSGAPHPTPVPPSALAPFIRLAPDQFVVHPATRWVGRATWVGASLVVAFGCGSLARLRPRSGHSLDDDGLLWPGNAVDHLFGGGDRGAPFYPGQFLSVESLGALRRAAHVRLLGHFGGGGIVAAAAGAARRPAAAATAAAAGPPFRPPASNHFVVLRVEPDEADVEWLMPLPGSSRKRGGGGGGGGGGRTRRGRDRRDRDGQPPTTVPASELTPIGLAPFDPSYWVIGGRGLWLGDEGGGGGGGGGGRERGAAAPRAAATPGGGEGSPPRRRRRRDGRRGGGGGGTEAAAAPAPEPPADEPPASPPLPPPPPPPAAGLAARAADLAASLRAALGLGAAASAGGSGPATAAASPSSSTPASPSSSTPASPRREGRRGRRRDRGGGGEAAPAAPAAPHPPPPAAATYPAPPTALVTASRTSVTVAWQDGSVQARIPAHALLPVTHLDDHDFWAHDLVEARARPADEEGGAAAAAEPGARPPARPPPSQRRAGVVVSCNSSARTAVVRWFPDSATGPRGPAASEADADAEFETWPAETVPVYAIRPHPDWAFAVGDIVLRLTPAKAEGAAAPATVGGRPGTKRLTAAERWAVGEVTALRRGRVAVRWTDTARPPAGAAGGRGTDRRGRRGGGGPPAPPPPLTLEAPGDLFVLSRDDDDGAGGGGDGDQGAGGPAGGATDARNLREEWEAALAARGSGEERAAEGGAAEGGAPLPTPPPLPPTASHASPPLLLADWPAFDTLEAAPSDHAFLTPPPSPPAAPRAWAKAVAKEWAVLAGGLPAGSAWARGCEGRMDLARFALAGAPGTPYHDHLFLFDAAFPPDYPASPPRLAYHSYGVRVNPNLYACGKVCLSLLGTWAGSRPGEAWDPGASTLLQVIVSIQGLVLVDEPYYQEAGYEKQAAEGGSAEASKNARLYSESAFLASARTALGLLRRPPSGFEALIQAHYRARRGAYLSACRQYVAGEAGIGGAAVTVEEGEGEGGGPSSSSAPPPAPKKSGPPPPTEGFRLMLKELLPALEKALGEL